MKAPERTALVASTVGDSVCATSAHVLEKTAAAEVGLAWKNPSTKPAVRTAAADVVATPAKNCPTSKRSS